MIGGIGGVKVTWEHYDAILGEGGEEKFEQITSEIDKNIEESEKANEAAAKKKTYSDLDPLEQLMYLLDSGIDRQKRIQEQHRFEHYRETQFRNYVRDAYGIY